MGSKNTNVTLNSVREAYSLLKPGQRFVICTPTATFSSALRSTLSPTTIIDPEFLRATSAPAGLRFVRSALRKRQNRILLLDLTATPSWLRSEKQRRAFFDQCMKASVTSKVPSVWLISRDKFSDTVIASIKDAVEFFLNISDVGSVHCAQFMAARGFERPEFFLPRAVTIEEEGLPLGSPVFPLAHSSSASLPEPPPIVPVEERYRSAFESANEGIIIFDLDGTYREINRRGSELLGYDNDEFDRVRLADLVPAGSLRRALRALLTLRRKGRVTTEVEIRKKNNRTAFLRLSAAATKDGCFVGILHDISETEKLAARLRQSGEQCRALLESSPYPNSVFVNGRLVLANRTFQTVFDVRLDGKSPTITIAEFFGKQNVSLIKELNAVGSNADNKVWKNEVRLDDAHGEGSHFEISASPVVLSGKKALQVTFVNITPLRQLVRQLEDSESKYRSVIEQSIDAISMSQDERFVFVNKGFLDMFGYLADEEVLGKEISVVAIGRDKKTLLERSRRRRAGETVPVRYEYQGVRTNGTLLTVEVQVASLMFGGKPTALAYHRDITQRIKAEADLRAKTKALEVLDKISTDVNQSIQLDEVLRSGLHATMKGTGFESGAMYVPDKEGGLTMAVHEGVSEEVLASLRRQSMEEGIAGYVVKTMEPLHVAVADYPPHLPYKSLFASAGIRNAAYVPLLAKDRLVAVMMLATSKERALGEHERALLNSIGTQLGMAVENASLYSQIKESEELYKSAVENIASVIYNASPNGTLSFMSTSVERLLGYKPRDFYASSDFWRTIIHVDDRALYSQRISNQDQQPDELHLEYRVLPKGKAGYRWIRDSVRYRRDSEGKVLSINGVLSDVTDTRILEEALTKSEELKTNVLESLQEGVVVFDTELKYIDWNKSMETMTGIRREDVVGKGVTEDGHGGWEGAEIPLLHRALAGEPVSSDDLELHSPSSNGESYVWIRYSPLRDKAGLIHGVVGIVTDVTNRKRLEREVRESEETLRNVIDAMGDALMISDLQGKVWEVNREFTHITGYPRSEVLGLDFPYPWVIEEEMARFVKWISELRDKNYMRDFDMTWRRKDGHAVAISLNTTLLRNAVGEPVAMLNIGRDISDRKRLSLELERRNKEIELLNRIIGKANTTLDFGDIFETIASEILNLVPYDQINVALLSADQRTMSFFACSSPSGKSLAEGVETPIENTVSKIAITRRRAVVIGKLKEQEGLDVSTTSIKEGLESQISIPIFLNERILGTLNIASLQEYAFSGAELKFLQPIADQIGAMIDRARLYQEVQAQVQRITALYELGKGLTGTLDIRTLLGVVFDEVSKALPTDQFLFQTFSASQRTLATLLKATGSTRTFYGPGSRTAETLVTEEMAIWDVVMNGVSYLGRPSPERESETTMAVPIRSKEMVVGVLSVIRSLPDAYTETHLRLFESIANLTSIAIDKAMLYEDTVNKSREIENRNKELDDFTYVVSHDLKEPLISIEGYSKIILKDYKDKVDEEGKEYIGSIIQSTSRMKSLIDDLLTLSRLGRVGEKMESIPVKELLDELLHEMQFTLREKHAVVQLPPELPYVHYDRTQLSMVFRNLVSNAVKFNDKPEPVVTIDVGRRDGYHVFSIGDNGIGISKDYYERIFMIFQRLQRHEEYHGTGAGLTIVKKIVEKHRGQIWVESVIGEGSTFHFTIPE